MHDQASSSSKLNGAPTVEVHQDQIRLIQRRHFGWIFVGFPVFFLSAFLLSCQTKGHPLDWIDTSLVMRYIIHNY